MIYVIQTGGKQYLVKSGDVLKVEKLGVEAGKEYIFEKVLLTANDDGSDVKIGNPTIDGMKVMAEVVNEGQSDKIRVVKYKRKVRYKKVYGHRQEYTKVKIK
jgi:large subunit ribosomal protein L21